MLINCLAHTHSTHAHAHARKHARVGGRERERDNGDTIRRERFCPVFNLGSIYQAMRFTRLRVLLRFALVAFFRSAASLLNIFEIQIKPSNGRTHTRTHSYTHNRTQHHDGTRARTSSCRAETVNIWVALRAEAATGTDNTERCSVRGWRSVTMHAS